MFAVRQYSTPFKDKQDKLDEETQLQRGIKSRASITRLSREERQVSTAWTRQKADSIKHSQDILNVLQGNDWKEHYGLVAPATGFGSSPVSPALISRQSLSSA